MGRRKTVWKSCEICFSTSRKMYFLLDWETPKNLMFNWNKEKHSLQHGNRLLKTQEPSYFLTWKRPKIKTHSWKSSVQMWKKPLLCLDSSKILSTKLKSLHTRPCACWDTLICTMIWSKVATTSSLTSTSHHSCRAWWSTIGKTCIRSSTRTLMDSQSKISSKLAMMGSRNLILNPKPCSIVTPR